jgi:hypothetical protein
MTDTLERTCVRQTIPGLCYLSSLYLLGPLQVFESMTLVKHIWDLMTHIHMLTYRLVSSDQLILAPCYGI